MNALQAIEATGRHSGRLQLATASADNEILVVIQAEHIAAVEAADEIYSVPGIDAVFVGPNDLAASLRKPDGSPPSTELMAQTLTRIREAAKRNNLPCGLHVYSFADVQRRTAEGWQFLAVGSELKFMLEGASTLMSQMAPEQAAGGLVRY